MTLPLATNFYVFIFQISILAVMDGIWLGFRSTIATDLAESSRYSGQASGYYHFTMAPTSISNIEIFLTSLKEIIF